MMFLSVQVKAKDILFKAAMTFESAETQTSIIEVYSSQGCSSCPPAERWVNKFIKNPHLWKSVIPMVFHVDYWDYIGWTDPFAQKEFSQRQQNYKLKGALKSVYTPGFLVNGSEWRGWFKGKNTPVTAQRVGRLTVSLDKFLLRAKFEPRVNSEFKKLSSNELVLNTALLGFGLVTKVNAGENRRKILNEEFVVLNHQQFLFDKQTSSYLWPKSDTEAAKYALVTWLSDLQTGRIIQATGGYLPYEWLSPQKRDLLSESD
jgi:hypothetical protein